VRDIDASTNGDDPTARPGLKNVKQATIPFPRRLARLLPPIAMLAAMLYLLVGCIYVPWFEHPDSTNPGTDFRPYMVEPGAPPNRPITPGRITRDQLVRLLGPPRYSSVDRSAIVYIFRTSDGWWVAPLCFTAAEGNIRTYAGRFCFDQDGLLQSIEVIDENAQSDPFGAAMENGESKIIARYNKDKPRLWLVPGYPSTRWSEQSPLLPFPRDSSQGDIRHER
jgi:hypothetical protein